MAAQLILLTMARDRMLPFSSFIARVNPRFQTPLVATVVVAVISLAVAVFLNADTITVLVNFGALTAFLGLNAAVFWFFIIHERRRCFMDLVSFGLLPLVGFLIIAYVWSGFDALTLGVGFSWLALGVVVLAVKTKGFRKPPPSMLKETLATDTTSVL